MNDPSGISALLLSLNAFAPMLFFVFTVFVMILVIFRLKAILLAT